MIYDKVFVLFVFVCISLGEDCEFVNYDEDHDHTSKERITPLKGKKYSATDESGLYSYEIGICTSVGSDPIRKAGAIQNVLNENGEKTKEIVLGDYLHTEILAGRDWIVLEYRNGDHYHSHCNSESRRVLIMLVCDEQETQGKLVIIEENNNKTGDCYYLFELSHQSACKNLQNDSGTLGAGSIVCIVFAVLGGLYLVGGIIYQRFVNQAQGRQQIPNYEFWQDVGNLAADGCEFVFRSDASSRGGDRQYRGIGDDQLRPATAEDPPSDTDEHLLPM